MFKNMNIAKKLIVSFIAAVIISSIAGVVGLILLKALDKGYSEALVTNGFVQGHIGNFNTNLQKGGAMTRDIFMATNEEDIAAAVKDLDDASKLASEALEKARPLCQSQAELDLFKIIDDTMPSYIAARDKAVALGEQNKKDEALTVFRTEAMPLLRQCISAGQELMDKNSSMGNAVSADLTAQSQIGMTIMILVILVATILAIMLALLVALSISRPIKACAERLVLLSEGDIHTMVPDATSKDETGIMLNALKMTTEFMNTIIGDIGHGLGEMANGNLTVAPAVEFKGDFISLKDSMEMILTSLNNTLGQINLASDQVSGGSDQVSSGAQALSQGATEQASSIEELAATITEISAQIKQNSDNAQAANGLSNEAGAGATESNKQMQEMIIAMGDISSKSNEIGKIIKTIDDIAFQTNILALNAAVEAARAGAAGKGFAVVADEVRNLAQKSAEAAKNTTALIEDTVAAVENGTKIADETAKSLQKVVEKIVMVGDKIDQIAKASEAQATASIQVTTGVDQISGVVQINSATAEESAAASEELSGQAQLLKDLVGEFRLRDDNNFGVQHTPDEEAPARNPALASMTFGSKY